MKYDKYINSPFFRFFEKLYALIILNIISFLCIIFGLGIFSIMPTITTLVLMIKSLNENDDVPLFKGFWISFKQIYKKAELTFIFYILILGLFMFNLYYFYSLNQECEVLFYQISYFLTLFIIVVILVAFINACFILVYFPHLSIKKTIYYSFSLLRVEIIKAIILFLMMIGTLFLSVWVVYLLPTILLSLYCLIAYFLLRNDYQKIIPEGYKSLDTVAFLEEDRSRLPKSINE